MDLYNPLINVCRGVESDILNCLIHSPLPKNPTLIARETGRSKSEVIKCLHFMADSGVIYRQTAKSRWYSIDSMSAIGDAWKAFTNIPHLYAEELAAIISSWTEQPESVTLACSAWAARFGVKNLLVIVHDQDQFPFNYQQWQINNHAKKRFNTTVSLVHGTAGEVLEILRGHGIEPSRLMWDCRTKAPRHIHGEDLEKLLAEQEGFEPPGLVGRPLSRRVH